MFVCCVGLSIFLLTIPKISTSTDPQKGEGAAFPSGPGDIAGIVRSVRGIARKFGLHDSDELVNFDLQGDGGGNNISYAKGRAGEEEQSVLTAAFTGNHGWFWRNRDGQDFKVTLYVRGDYSEMKLP
tara:strand:- start:4353 stop:4733 length:381 start_codon:yes stop_codon:yes gene_type:complete